MIPAARHLMGAPRIRRDDAFPQVVLRQ